MGITETFGMSQREGGGGGGAAPKSVWTMPV